MGLILLWAGVMGQSTEQLVAQYFSSFNHADWDGMLALMSKDVIHDLNESNRQVGLEAFTAQLNANKQSFLEVISDIETDVPNPSRAIAAYTISGQYLATAPGMPTARGQRYRVAGKSIFDIRDGKITRIISEFDEASRRKQREADS